MVDEGGEVLEGAHIVDLVLDGRRHEGGEPPARHLGPHGRVHHHEGLKCREVYDEEDELKSKAVSCIALHTPWQFCHLGLCILRGNTVNLSLVPHGTLAMAP